MRKLRMGVPIGGTFDGLPKCLSALTRAQHPRQVGLMGVNSSEYREAFLAWLKKRIESVGYTVDSAPDYLRDAYLSGDPKDLNALVWTEWYEYNDPDWRQRARGKGGLQSRHGEQRESPKLKKGFNG